MVGHQQFAICELHFELNLSHEGEQYIQQYITRHHAQAAQLHLAIRISWCWQTARVWGGMQTTN